MTTNTSQRTVVLAAIVLSTLVSGGCTNKSDASPSGSTGSSRLVPDIGDADLKSILGRSGAGSGPINIISRGDVGDGKTAGAPSRIIQVKYTWEWGGGVFRSCSLLHYTYDPEWKTFQKIIVSVESDMTRGVNCSTSNIIFGGGGATFADALKGLGYEGSLELPSK